MLLWILILVDLRGGGCGLGARNAARSSCRRARGPVLDRRGLSSVHSSHVQSVRATCHAADRRQGPQSAAAGSGTGHSSAAPLPRLCRAFDHLFLRRRGTDLRAHRRGLGAAGSSLDPHRLGVFDTRYRDGLLLGLLHAWLGRLLVLGPGRECFAHAVARGDRPASFGDRDGEARGPAGLDDLSRHSRLFAVADRHVHRPLGCPDLGPCLRQRPAARRLHIGDSRVFHWRLVAALRASRKHPETRRLLCADLARRRARAQQPGPFDLLCDGLHRYSLSAGARSAHRRENFGWAAFLQRDLRSALLAAYAS